MKCKIQFILKFSKFQDEFMKSSFLPKYEPNIVRIYALYCATLHYREEFLTIFGSYFGRNDDVINPFWNLMTFNWSAQNVVLHYLVDLINNLFGPFSTK